MKAPMGWDFSWQTPLRAGMARQTERETHSSLLFNWPLRCSRIGISSKWWRPKSVCSRSQSQPLRSLFYEQDKGKNPIWFFFQLNLGSLGATLIPKRNVPQGWGLCVVFQCSSLHSCVLEIGRWLRVNLTSSVTNVSYHWSLLKVVSALTAFRCSTYTLLFCSSGFQGVP